MGKGELKTTICRGRVHSIDEVKDNEEDEDGGVLIKMTESTQWIKLDYQIREALHLSLI